METLGYYNGETGEIEDMKIPMNDRASWFGDGVYDAALAVDHRIVFLEEHVDRFFASAALLGMVPPLDRNALRRLLAELVLNVESGCQFVYWQLTRGTGPRAHVFPGTKSNLWVFLRPSSPPDFSRKLKLITVPDTRFFHCNIKTLNLIPNVLASQKAKEAGADEAVFYRTPETAGAAAFSSGSLTRVTECAHSNVSIISNGVFWTAPLDNFILAGIARSRLIKQCRALGIPVREEAFGLEELFSAGEIIVSSSGVLCMEVSHIDGKSVGGKDGATAARLRKAVLDEVEAYLGNGAPASYC